MGFGRRHDLGIGLADDAVAAVSLCRIKACIGTLDQGLDGVAAATGGEWRLHITQNFQEIELEGSAAGKALAFEDASLRAAFSCNGCRPIPSTPKIYACSLQRSSLNFMTPRCGMAMRRI